MYRSILAYTLTTIFLIGTTPLLGNENRVVDDEAQIGIEVDFSQIMKDKLTAELMEKNNANLPPFIKEMTSMNVYVSLPNSMAEINDPSSVQFFASLSFTSAKSCESAFSEMFRGAPTEDVEKQGKTFKKIAMPNSPTVYLLQDGKSIKAYSEKYVDKSSMSFASAGLQKALGRAPKSEPVKMAVDMKSMKDLLAEVGTLAPQAAAFANAESIVMAGGGNKDLMFMVDIATPDESTAKKVKSTLQAGISVLALGMASQLPSEEDAPATNEMIQHLMKNLKPKTDGTSIKVIVNKPENYDKLRKDMLKEAPAIGGGPRDF